MSLWSWSKTAADNDDADATINAREGMAPSLVNNGMRAIMAAVAKYRDDRSGVLATGGSASAYTVTTNQVYGSLADGISVTFRAAATNDAGPTINVDSLGAKPLRMYTGVSLAAGRVLIGSVYSATYRLSTDEWLINGADGATDGITAAGVAMIEAANAAAQATLLGLNTTLMSGLVGSVVDYAGATAPNGWLLCYGQEISRSTYSALFTAIGTTYGAGDTSTTFNLPDLRGRVVAGQDDMGGTSANRLTNQSGGLNGDTLGATGGAETHTLTDDELAAHKHLMVVLENGGATAITNANQITHTRTVGVDAQRYAMSGTSNAADGGLTGEVGSDDPHNNVQPTIILNKMIFTGVFS